MDKTIFVQNVKKICELRKIKPTIACRESGAGVNLISQLENRGTIPSVERVQLLARYLDVTTSELLGEVPVSAGGLELEGAELELLAAYRLADARARDMVSLALSPWLSQGEAKPQAM